MSTQGYYRFPAIYKDDVVFVSEDDLWTVPVKGGVARRLTANLGAISFPYISPDGKTIAFTGREEGGSEVYVMPMEGGPVKRITFLGAMSTVQGWTPDGKKILFATNSGQPFGMWICAVSPEGGLPESWPVGMAVAISIGKNGRTVIGRNNNDPARWKRYRGGTAGDLWVDEKGGGEFHRLITLKGNLARPMYVGKKIYFVSDHEGVGNLYSCLADGSDLKRHTEHIEYFVRFPSTDGERIVYHAGADLYVYDVEDEKEHKVKVQYHSPRVHRQRKFVEAGKYLESADLHPQGHSLAINARGKSFTLGNWEGSVSQQNAGDDGPIRSRLTRWLNDGERVVTVTDVEGVDVLEIHDAKGKTAPIRLEGLDIGRARAVEVSPKADQILVANHRNELLFVDLAEKKLTVVDKSEYGAIGSMNWAPDGVWVTYNLAATSVTSAIKLWNRDTGKNHPITEPILIDGDPVFDPEGKYIYFLGQREFNPVYDGLHFDLGFPKGVRPYLITLKADEPSPFIPKPKPLSEEPPKPDEKKDNDEGEAEKKDEPKPLEIDLEGIAQRILAFPVPEGKYGDLAAIKGKALWTIFPVEGALEFNLLGDSGPKGALQAYDFKDLESTDLVGGLSSFRLSRDGKTLVYRADGKLRVVAAGAKVEDDPKKSGSPRKSGWVDLGRIKISVDPSTEWHQMAREAWRLQKEFFWTPTMSDIDWNKVWKRYSPLVDRVGTRGEFSDLMWEMQAELGTSHCYEAGGDYRPEPSYPQGFLGADYAYDAKSDAYVIKHIAKGAAGETKAFSPLMTPGANIKEGDKLVAIGGRKLSKDVLPQELLVNRAGSEVALTIEDSKGDTRDVTVTALPTEGPLRYREWVETNRRYVHEKTGGKVGYVHIPDMGGRGYAEFHRLYLSEVHYDAMIVDVRFNGGGHVSQLIIEKLARRRVGYDEQRWGAPEPYPSSSVAGPMVAITNQFAGSDGDIFSHVWKLKKLGTLIGKRTWGGVIGIWPRNPLADGSITTQPEFSFWFMDVGWGVENYGTDPDVDIDVAPQDYVKGYDPQIEKAIALVTEQLAANPPLKPTFDKKPSLKLPEKLKG